MMALLIAPIRLRCQYHPLKVGRVILVPGAIESPSGRAVLQRDAIEKDGALIDCENCYQR